MPETSDYCCSDRLSRTILMGMEEVIGPSGINTVLNQSGLPSLADHNLLPDYSTPISFKNLSAMQLSLERLYGPRGGAGLAWQTGRAAFNYGIRDFGLELGLLNLDFRLLPPASKARVGLQRLAAFLGSTNALEIHQEETSDQFFWVVKTCPVCWERQADREVCHLLVGFTQEYLYWASGGKYYNVFEMECIASGAQACKISIDKQAVD